MDYIVYGYTSRRTVKGQVARPQRNRRRRAVLHRSTNRCSCGIQMYAIYKTEQYVYEKKNRLPIE